MNFIHYFRYLIPIGFFSLIACQKDAATTPPPASNTLYFPPASGTWQTTTPASLGWNTAALEETYAYLQSKQTKAFIILHNGRLVSERYFGSFTADSNWYWASAGKTATALLVGIAQREGFLKLTDRVSAYLGAGWTALPPAQENMITIGHQLAMTTGLDDGVPDNHCTLPACLQYKAAAGTRWAYHNAPYTLLEKVVERATGMSYNNYFNEKIRKPTGMNGIWLRSGDWNNVYFSNARSMARFGLLLLANANWDGQDLLKDAAYQTAMIQSSQNLNPSYGYLTWLNGKGRYMLPGLAFVFNSHLVPNAPADMYAALGRDDQKIYVVPSKNLVIIRMGLSAGNVQLALSSFDNELWGYLQKVF